MVNGVFLLLVRALLGALFFAGVGAVSYFVVTTFNIPGSDWQEEQKPLLTVIYGVLFFIYAYFWGKRSLQLLSSSEKVKAMEA